MKKSNKDITKENLKKVDDLLKNVKNMSDDDYQEFLKTCSLFYEYSFFNQVILYFAGATNVKGFQSWKKIGRTVKKGAKAIWILAPVTYTVKDEATEEEERRISRFKSVPVFDIADTEGEELPSLMTGKTDIKLETVIDLAKCLGHEVETQNLKYALGGYIDKTGRIVINTVRPECDQVGTLIHELSHGLLKHHEQEEFNRSLCEQEAETLTYLISQALGIERKSEGYLKNWTMTESIKKSMKSINTAYKTFMNKYEQVSRI
ncbi:MAG: ArdC-like ssDNA-binding domain-containing protein [Spirochaetes bacterium]|nr:ArdC-like ssDNA-binding domain-containing protein [Spirochaetota bacterium]